jgi:uncharacterized DUF497 family protein
VKHGVSTEEIESIFRSPIVSDVDVRHSIDEKRWYAVGVLPMAGMSSWFSRSANGRVRV